MAGISYPPGAHATRTSGRDYLFREGGDADHFYVIMHGRVALQLHSPGTGALILYTVSDGEVLGWPWLIPPHRWPFDAQAVESAGEPRA